MEAEVAQYFERTSASHAAGPEAGVVGQPLDDPVGPCPKCGLILTLHRTSAPMSIPYVACSGQALCNTRFYLPTGTVVADVSTSDTCAACTGPNTQEPMRKLELR